MKLYVYGTGCGAGELIDSVLPVERVTAFVDGLGRGGSFLGRPVISPETLAKCDYDLVIVTSGQTEEIAARCAALGIDPDKLLFLKNHLICTDRNRSYERAESLLGSDFVKRLRSSQRLIRRPDCLGEERLPPEALDNDYVRVKTLEALCRRLDSVPGAAAELGVFRGGFARCINALLPDRTLYLFDSFEGFDERETEGSGRGFVEAHRDTAAERVLRALPHPDRAVIRQGFFPDSAAGLEERFALVSLDVDLEESSYQGLCWFLPRLSAGGYLLLHDWQNPKLPGVRAALDHWERERGKVSAVPICDVNGTLIICG